MSQISPFVHAVIQGAVNQQQQAIIKERQLRRAAAQAKDIAAQDDVLEHQVESADETPPVNDEAEKKNPGRQPRHRKDGKDAADEEPPHIDLTA